MAKIAIFFLLKFNFSFLKKFEIGKKILLQSKATLSLWFQPKHNYVVPAVTEWIYVPVGLRHAWFSAVGLFLGRKSKILHEQNVKKFQFYIRMPYFSFLGSIIKESTLKVVDTLKLHSILAI